MSGNIFGVRYVGREAAWHQLGTVFDRPVTAVEAATLCGLDYQVHKAPLSVTIDGAQIAIPDQYALVRSATFDDDQPRVFGVCGPQYTPLQNMDLARQLDDLTATWPVETMGALGLGERVFMTLDAGDGEVHGEAIRKYFLVTDGKTPRDGLTIAFTPVRVVCQNTLTTALAAATINVELRHTGDILNRFSSVVELSTQMQRAQDALMEALNILADARITTKQAKAVLQAAYPDPKKPGAVALSEAAGGGILADGVQHAWIKQRATAHEAKADRMVAHRATTLQLFEKFNDEFPAVGGTAWAIYNAVTEYCDHREMRGGTNPMNALFGWGAAAKARAFSASMTLASGKAGR